MSIKLKPLRDQVIVITGATSGIGLATARAAHRAGARLVLAARSETNLHTVAQQLGRRVAVVVADTANPADIKRIADTARSHFGGFDTWVNNAGVGMWGKIEQGNRADFQRLFDTNFWGYVNGSLEALKVLKARGGALINVSSVVADVAVPIQGMYSASKHAVKGFTDALRIELREEKAPVSVTSIKPAAINTPFPQHARNYLDREPQLPPPVYAPEEVAAAILYAAEHPIRDLFVGGGGKLMSSTQHYAPGVMDWMNKKMMALEKGDQNPRHPAGTLHRPDRFGAHVHGQHPGHVMQTSLYTRAQMHPLLAGALAATGLAVGVAAVAGAWRGRPKTAEPLVPDTDE